MKIQKPLFLLFVGSLLFANGQAQVADTVSRHHFKPDKDALAQQYLEKARNLRAIGIPLAAVGTIAWVAGAKGTYDHYDFFTGEGSGYVICMGLGIGATISGIVLMIRSGVYQSKAKFLLDQENISQMSRLPIKGNLVSLRYVIPLK